MKKPAANEFAAVFTRLRAILQKHMGRLTATEDTSSCYRLAGGLHPEHKQPMPVAWVRIGKRYVSFHHMGVYGCPKLLDGISKELKSRMQGKSCFNFKTTDEALFQELDQLTVAAFTAFRKAGYIP